MGLRMDTISKEYNMMTKHNFNIHFRETSRCSNFNENNNSNYNNQKMQIYSKEQQNKRDLEENHKVFPLFLCSALSSHSFYVSFVVFEIEEIHGIHEYRIGKIGIGLKQLKCVRRRRVPQLLPVL